MPSNDPLSEAKRLHHAGQLQEAFVRYQAILQDDPRNADALHFSGMALYQAGDLPNAIARLRASIGIRPDVADVWSNLGLALDAVGQREAAVNAFKEALKIAPQSVEVLGNLAAIEVALGRAAEGEAAARAGLAVNASHPAAWYNLALALQAQNRPLEALDAAGRAAALAPELMPAAGLKAQLEQSIGATDRARATYESALARHPLASALRFEYAGLLEQQGDPAAAAAAYADVLRREPGFGPALSQSLFVRREIADWSVTYDLERRVAAAVQRGDTLVSPFVLLSSPSSRALQRQAAEQWCRRLGAVAPAPGRRRRLSPDRLRIGYLSADFRTHATAFLAAGMFETHDRDRFIVHAYSIGSDDGSPMRARLVGAFDRFLDAAALTPSALAQRIRADGVDILVDLKGHTAGAPPHALALRPAPIQVHYLGYPGTLGGGLVDYLVGDATVTPPEHASDYAEMLVRLPGCYQINDRNRPIAPTPARTALGLPGDALVLCNFSAIYKLNPAVFDAWAEVLAALPGSVLWLLAPAADHPAVANLQREIGRRGIDPSRLVFATRRPNPEYLALFRAADLFLDTWPYTAHTTGSDALWAGCPVLTVQGDTFASRVGASLLRAVGLPELIAENPRDFVERAVALGRDRTRLAALRAHLEGPGRDSPLFDTVGTTRALERAYLAMADQYRRIERRPIDL